jgi:hypothetical protein
MRLDCIASITTLHPLNRSRTTSFDTSAPDLGNGRALQSIFTVGSVSMFSVLINLQQQISSCP